MKKVRETTRPLRYDLNKISYDYTVEKTNRLKGLDLIECLKNYGQRFISLYSRLWPKPYTRRRNATRQSGCLGKSYEYLRKEMKGKEENKRYIELNAELQRKARRDKKTFLSEQCKRNRGK